MWLTMYSYTAEPDDIDLPLSSVPLAHLISESDAMSASSTVILPLFDVSAIFLSGYALYNGEYYS